MTQTILVLGATGKTGRRLVPRLAARGVTVRAASRQSREGHTLFDWDPGARVPSPGGAGLPRFRTDCQDLGRCCIR
jgi:nucleoside-diphosphate-sugar epimerase